MIEDATKQKDFLKKFTSINRTMEEEEAAKKARLLGVPYLDLTIFPIDMNAVALMTLEQATDAESVFFYKDGNDLRIATINPSNQLLEERIKQFVKNRYRTTKYLVSRSSLKQVMALYDKIPKPTAVASEELFVSSQNDYIQKLKGYESSVDASTTDILETMLGAAGQYRASDIHIEAEEHIVKVRMRIDGVLVDIVHLPKAYQKPLISRIKIIAKLKLNIEDVPQDGRFTFTILKTSVDVRVSILPGAFGEGVVMRILSSQAISLKLDDLGLRGHAYTVIAEELSKPNGMVVTTGPTGSGKTTTLYAFLNQLNVPGVKIITLEDPVEYKLEGINQTPISAATGLTFASGLRAILRQDPDIIMVGEIRDQETADTALQAALTGHVVLSTLHTNDAAGAIPRLINMGVKPFVIAPGLNAIIAQRLVRRLCSQCKKVTTVDASMLEKVHRVLAAIPANAEVVIPQTLVFSHAPGCPACGGLGYKGRIGIYEVIKKTNELEKLILSMAPTSEIKKLAVEQGMVTMIQDGIVKALEGITDLEEVFRVTEE